MYGRNGITRVNPGMGTRTNSTTTCLKPIVFTGNRSQAIPGNTTFVEFRKMEIVNLDRPMSREFARKHYVPIEG